MSKRLATTPPVREIIMTKGRAKYKQAELAKGNADSLAEYYEHVATDMREVAYRGSTREEILAHVMMMGTRAHLKE